MGSQAGRINGAVGSVVRIAGQAASSVAIWGGGVGRAVADALGVGAVGAVVPLGDGVGANVTGVVHPTSASAITKARIIGPE